MGVSFDEPVHQEEAPGAQVQSYAREAHEQRVLLNVKAASLALLVSALEVLTAIGKRDFTVLLDRSKVLPTVKSNTPESTQVEHLLAKARAWFGEGEMASSPFVTTLAELLSVAQQAHRLFADLNAKPGFKKQPPITGSFSPAMHCPNATQDWHHMVCKVETFRKY
jgi:hypothetical protein